MIYRNILLLYRTILQFYYYFSMCIYIYIYIYNYYYIVIICYIIYNIYIYIWLTYKSHAYIQEYRNMHGAVNAALQIFL